MNDDYRVYREYRAVLDDILTNGTPQTLRAFMRKKRMRVPDPELAEVIFHKTRTGAKTISTSLRRESRDWLTARGYQSWDDGDLDALR